MPGKAEGGPRKRPIGTAWRDGSHITIPMTTMYELNPATGQVGLSWYPSCLGMYYAMLSLLHSMRHI